MTPLIGKLQEEYPTKVWQLLAVLTAIGLTWVAGIVGTAAYVKDQRESTQRSVALARYENARDEQVRCEQRVESRAQIRGAFLDVYDLIDDISPDNLFTSPARLRLDDTYPPLLLDDCPPIPVLIVD